MGMLAVRCNTAGGPPPHCRRREQARGLPTHLPERVVGSLSSCRSSTACPGRLPAPSHVHALPSVGVKVRRGRVVREKACYGMDERQTGGLRRVRAGRSHERQPILTGAKTSSRASRANAYPFSTHPRSGLPLVHPPPSPGSRGRYASRHPETSRVSIQNLTQDCDSVDTHLHSCQPNPTPHDPAPALSGAWRQGTAW